MNNKLVKLFIYSFLFVFSLAICNIVRVLATSTILSITDASIVEKSDTVDASIDRYESNKFNISTTFHKVNDYVTYKLIIKNNKDKKYTIKSITDDNNNSNIYYEYGDHKDEEFDSNEEKELIIKAIYKNGVTNINKRDVNNNFKIIFVLVDEDGNEVIDNIIINPKTGDNVTLYLIIGSIALIGLIILKVKNKKYLLLLLFVPVITKASTVSYYIEFNSQLKMHDKLLVKLGNEEIIVDYGSKLSSVEDPVKEGYTFDGWYIGEEEFDFDTVITEDLVIKPKYNLINYTIEYYLDGGEADNVTSYNVETDTFSLDNPTKDKFTFIGWTGSNGDTPELEVKINKGSIGNKRYVANYETNLTCKLATSLHSETCERTSQGCVDAGYTVEGKNATDQIVYGNIAGSTTPMSGDAYDCDLNGDKVYDSDTERFYYLRNNGDKAVLFYFSNYEGEDGIKNENIWLYDVAPSKLPTTSQWSNLTEIFDGKPARFPTMDDFADICPGNQKNKGAFDKCIYLYESTRFKSATIGRTGYWLIKDGEEYIRMFSSDRKLMTVTSASYNGARPVIEVPMDLIETNKTSKEKYSITFDSDGGNNIQGREVYVNNIVGNLEIPKKQDYIFQGWYTDNTFTTKVTSATIVTSNMNIVAKWQLKDAVAKIGDTEYSSLYSAVNAVPNTGVKTTIDVISDITLDSTLKITNINKNIELDLHGYTLSYNGGNVIKTKATMIIKNGTITCSAGSGAIDVEVDGKLYTTNLEIKATGSRQALYNNGGYVEIDERTILSSTTNQRATLQNLNNGTLIIKSGTITSTNYSAIVNDSGVLIIGTKDGSVNSVPVIQGFEYGVLSTPTYKYYDGIIKGKTSSVNDESLIDEIETGTSIKHSTEVIDTETYDVINLE